jgi:FkbM family methyltransferase
MKLFHKRSSHSIPPPQPDKGGRTSYSQCGEDLILEHILGEYLHIAQPSYLDLGAHHPTYLSNTYRFYHKGSRGVCVEPDPVLFPPLQTARPRDVCLNVGVGASGAGAAEFYVMSSRTLNTFSRQEAERYQSYGTHKIQEVVEVPLLSVNEILEKHFDTRPDFVSLDVEGLDLEILKSFDFSRFRPPAFCVETLTYTEDKSEEKMTEILDLMSSRGYFTYADTYINTIFVEREMWRKR